MSNQSLVGKRLLPREHIALVEAFHREANPELQTARDFRSFIVPVTRVSLLSEQTPELFAKVNGFELLKGDQVALNPHIAFQVETLEPAPDFSPSSPTPPGCAGAISTAMSSRNFC
jgi:hypothetical protein